MFQNIIEQRNGENCAIGCNILITLLINMILINIKLTLLNVILTLIVIR